MQDHTREVAEETKRWMCPTLQVEVVVVVNELGGGRGITDDSYIFGLVVVGSSNRRKLGEGRFG